MTSLHSIEIRDIHDNREFVMAIIVGLVNHWKCDDIMAAYETRFQIIFIHAINVRNMRFGCGIRWAKIKSKDNRISEMITIYKRQHKHISGHFGINVWFSIHIRMAPHFVWHPNKNFWTIVLGILCALFQLTQTTDKWSLCYASQSFI